MLILFDFDICFSQTFEWSGNRLYSSHLSFCIPNKILSITLWNMLGVFFKSSGIRRNSNWPFANLGINWTNAMCTSFAWFKSFRFFPSKVYINKSDIIEGLKPYIRTEVNNVPLEAIKNIIDEFKHRLGHCADVIRGYFRNRV